MSMVVILRNNVFFKIAIGWHQFKGPLDTLNKTY